MTMCSECGKIDIEQATGLSKEHPKGTFLGVNTHWARNGWAVVMAQLVERLLTTPEVRSSNPVIDKNVYWTFTVNWIEKMKMKKKRPGLAHFFLKKTWFQKRSRPQLRFACRCAFSIKLYSTILCNGSAPFTPLSIKFKSQCQRTRVT